MYNYQIDLSKQVDLLPIKLRFLRNFIKFLNSNLSNLPKTLLMAYIKILSKFLIYFYLIILTEKNTKDKFFCIIYSKSLESG